MKVRQTQYRFQVVCRPFLFPPKSADDNLTIILQTYNLSVEVVMDKVIGSAVFLVFVVWFIAHVLPYIFIGILVILGIVAGVAILAGLASLISKN